MKILITAFEPFNHQKNNSSQEVLSFLHDKNLIKAILPVTYEGCKMEIKKLIRENHPDFVLSLGQYGGSSTLRIEKVGLNYTHSFVADNNGIILLKGEVKPNGKEAIFTSFDIESLIDKINTIAPTVLSLSAGSFICNSTYYTALDEMKANALFVHLPYYEGQGKDLLPTIKKEIMVKAVEEIINQIKNSHI